MNSKFKNYITFVIGWPLTILAFFFIGKVMFSNGNTITTAFRDINIPVLILSSICFLVYFFLRALFWQKLLKAQGHDLPLRAVSYSWAFSEIKRYIPGNVWSIATRIQLFGKQEVPYKTILSDTVYEMHYLIFGSAIISLATANFILYSLFPQIAYGWFIILVISYVILAGSFIFVIHQHALKPYDTFLFRLIKRVLPPFNYKLQFSFLCITIFALVFFGLGTYLSISAFVPLYVPHVVSLLAFFVFSLLVGYLSFITPMGLGVREGVITVGLSRYIGSATAGFAAIFSRLIFIISEIIFTIIIYVWHTNTSPIITRIEQFVSKHKTGIILTALFLAYIFYFSTASWLRYTNFYTGRFDLGNMDQTVWNTLHGRFFMLTDPNGTQNISRLAFHADFILVLLTPFYVLWQDPRMLLIVQSIVLGFGGIFIYLIGKDLFKDKKLSLLFAFLYYINPAVAFTNLYDFHGVTLATTFLLGAWYFLKRHRFVWMSLFLLLAGLTKEEIWVIPTLFGVYLFFFEKKKIWGIAIASISAVLFYILFFKAIPLAKGGQHFALSFYSDFGGSSTEVIKTLITNPLKVLATITKQKQVTFLLQLFSPLGFLSLFSPILLLFPSADWAIDLLSSGTTYHEIYYQYTAPLTPFIFIAGMYGSYFLLNRIPKITKYHVTIYLVVTGLIAAYFYGPLPGARGATVMMFSSQQPNKEFIDNFLESIPKRFSVASTNNIGSHLSRRQNIYTIPVGIDKADIILFLLNDPFAQPSPKAQQEMETKMKQDKNYIEIMHLGDFIVFEKRNLYNQQEPIIPHNKLYPFSIPTLQNRDFTGGPITLESTPSASSAFVSELISFPSDGLKEQAKIQTPRQQMPRKGFPVIIINHDYVTPSMYTSIAMEDQIAEYFTREGFMVVRPDFRGNGKSESDTALPQTLAYPVDTLNLFSSISVLPTVDKEHIFLWGESIGGTITLTTLAAHNQNENFTIPITGAALWAPITNTYTAYHVIGQDFPRGEKPYEQTVQQFKTPQQNPAVWEGFSPIYYLDDITTPIQINQGLDDTLVPYQRSIELYTILSSYNQATSLRLYKNEGHTFSSSWRQAAHDNVIFFKKLLQ